MKRTHLPLNGLRVLDAAARHLSFTRAADELAVTPAAVGQQIRALEDMLGLVLFRRTPRGLELTPEAEAGLDALRRGFLEFEEAVRAMQSGQASAVLTIAAPRDLTAKWLGPKLAQHSAANPGLTFHLVSSDEAIDFTQANLDLAICYADGPGEHEGQSLGEVSFVQIAAPGIDAEAPHIGWPGCPADDGAAGFRVSDAGLAVDAAAAGLGRAFVPDILAAADLAAGRVIELGTRTSCRTKSYWLVAPLPQWRQKKVKALVATLTA